MFFNSYYRDLPDSVYVVTDDRKAGLQAVDLLILRALHNPPVHTAGDERLQNARFLLHVASPL